MDRKVIGKATPRVEGPDKVTGAAKYSADVNLPGMLWGKILRSPYAHARIRGIDTSKAKALPGVHCVITGEEFPHRTGRAIKDLHVLAIGKVRFVGDRVAAVAADSADIAEEALSLIEVDYEELPAVSHALDAIRPDAPAVHEDPKSYENAFTHPAEPKIPNLCAYFNWKHGDIDAGLGEADLIIEESFHTPAEHHGYLEPNACVADIKPDGSGELWASNKSPYMLRLQLGQCFGVDPASLKLHLMHVGGDFGGKGNPFDTPVAYLLSRESGRPVKIVKTYTEELMAANVRHASDITVKLGVKKDGTITGLQLNGYFNGGAYGAFKPLPTLNLHGVDQAASTYRVPAIDLHSHIIYTNTIPGGHMRSPGSPQTTFAVERSFDIAARKLGMDPGAFRLKNVLQQGDASPTGNQWQTVKARDTLEAAMKAVNWGQRSKEPYVGVGLGMYERGTVGGDCSARLTLNSDGVLEVLVPIPDPGQGSTTAILQMVEEEFSLAPAQVRVKRADATDELPFDFGVGGSRTTYALGLTVMNAAKQLKAKLAELVPGGDGMDWSELAGKATGANGGPVVVNGYEKLELLPNLPDTNFTAQAVEVAVDPETGKVTIRKVVTVHDVGTIINPVGHRGQIEGGMLYGLAEGTMAEYIWDEGKPAALHLGDYKLPNIRDIPPLETIVLERDEGPGPFNLGPIAEASNVPIAAAFANAISDAIGKEIHALPLHAERVWQLMHG